MRSETRQRLNTVASLAAGLTAGVFAYRENKSRHLVERVAAAALETLLNAIQANDEETGMHVRRVAAYALVIGDEAGLEERQCHAVERVALFHDVGKIHEALFDIVHEGKRLSREERRKIATHPRRGAAVLAPLATFYPELPAGVLAHHERWDGSGYPRGLRGERIPLESRIVTIADTFDALTHTRRYRRGRSIEAALAVIREGRGRQFDPALVDLVLAPHVVDRLSRTHLDQTKRAGRRSGTPERGPDVSFRWRSESLGA